MTSPNNSAAREKFLFMDRLGEKMSLIFNSQAHYCRSITVIFIFLFVELIFAVFIRQNDIALHLKHGEAFLHRDLSKMTWTWYPLARYMFDGFLALFPYYLARFLCFSLAIAATVRTGIIWNTILDIRNKYSKTTMLNICLITLLITFTFVNRDLDECGLHLLLLYFLSAGVYALWLNRPLRAGFWFAAAACYKTTPVLILPFLIYKRRFKAATYMFICITALNLLPAFYLGINKTITYNFTWIQRITDSIRLEDPSKDITQDSELHNQSLSNALARYLMTYHHGQKIHVNHWLTVYFFDFSPRTANYIAKAIMGTMVLYFLWRFRKKDSANNPLEFSIEWAVMCLLTMFLSPLCLNQHLVVSLPCAYIVVWNYYTSKEKTIFGFLGIAIPFILINGSNVSLVGRTVSALARSYHTFSIAIIILLIMIMSIKTNATN